MTESVSLIAKTLMPFAKAILPQIRRLHTEGKVRRGTLDETSDLLENGMNKTLERLIGGKDIDKWWKKLLNSIGHSYISPEFLNINAIGEWLSDSQVQSDLKSLARKTIMGQKDRGYDQDTFSRLRKKYAAKTGENKKLANGPIEVIVAIIVAGYLGSINTGIDSVAGMLQEHDRELKKEIEKIDNSLKSIDSKMNAINLNPQLVKHEVPHQAANPNIRISIAHLPTSEKEMFGRESELNLMNQAWSATETNILSVVAFGGVGKTALVNHWLNQMDINAYDGVTRVYGWSFYSQGAKEGTQVSAEDFFAHTLKWFGDPDPSSGSPWDKGLRLAEFVQRERMLFILDGMEPLQYPPGPMFGKLKDQGLRALIRELRRYNPGLCVITTRTHLDDIADAINQTVWSLDLENLAENAGSQFLQILGVKGTEKELKHAVVDFGGHALALSLLGRYLSIVHDGDINKRDLIPALTKEEKHGGHARRVMESYEKWLIGTPELEIVRMMGLFDRPADGGAIEALRKPPVIAGLTDIQGKLSQAEWKYAVKRLRDLRLLAAKDEYQPDSLDCHPLVREHFEEKLKDKNPNAWIEANSKLYEYYRDLPNKNFPDTMVEMEPLFLAVSHGCKAGRHQEAMETVFW